jgi:hypothetical protein
MYLRAGSIDRYRFAFEFHAVRGSYCPDRILIVCHFDKRFCLTRLGISEDLEALNGSVCLKD